MKSLCIVCMLTVGFLSTAVFATPAIDVGTFYLQENTAGQTVQIYVTGGDSVTGFNLKAQIGDGTGSLTEPVFTAMSFSGSIWDAYSYSSGGGPISNPISAPQFADGYVYFDAAVTIPASGLLVTLTIDTTGFYAGSTFDLLLAESEIGTDSNFVLVGGESLSANIINGSIVIVPEPATLALLSAAGIALIRRKRR